MRRSDRPSLRRKMLITINMVVVIGLAILVVVDYQIAMSGRFQARLMGLQDEAKTLAVGVESLRHHGESALQTYIDRVCSRMQERHSPGHHIVVETAGRVYQAEAHHRGSPQMLSALRAASSSTRGQVNGQEFVVASAQTPDARVLVSEFTDDIRNAVRDQLIGRIAGLVTIGILGALVCNLVLVRFVTRPIENLSRSVQRIAQGQLGDQIDLSATAELADLADAFNRMSTSLATSAQRREAQLRKAASIQSNLLPDHERLRLLGVYFVCRAADEVGGDYLDVIESSDGELLVCIADVVGHGVPAAMGAAMLKMLSTTAAAVNPEPGEMLSHIDERFAKVTLGGDFASMLVLRLNRRDGTLQYANAGHEPGYLVSTNGDLVELDTTGTLLGIDAESDWPCRRVPCSRGDRIVLLTDGLIEVSDPSGVHFGRDRMVDLVRSISEMQADQAGASILDAVDRHRIGADPDDDQSIMIIEV